LDKKSVVVDGGDEAAIHSKQNRRSGKGSSILENISIKSRGVCVGASIMRMTSSFWIFARTGLPTIDIQRWVWTLVIVQVGNRTPI
jgi:hypothetical protein